LWIITGKHARPIIEGEIIKNRYAFAALRAKSMIDSYSHGHDQYSTDLIGQGLI
jgi:hypothetical protein